MRPQDVRISKSKLWLFYVSAFVILVFAITTSHILADWMVDKQEEYADIINKSGKQRMLSQRISGMVTEAALETENGAISIKVGPIADAIETMSNAHAFLTDAQNIETQHVLTDAVKDIYYGDRFQLDVQVNQFLNDAKQFKGLLENGTSPPKAELIEFAEFGFGPLLKNLDLVVQQYQMDAEETLSTLKTFNIVLWVFTMFIIVVELAFVFRPLANKLDEAQQKLQDIAHTDPLTGCWNRRAFMQSANSLLALAQRNARPLSVIMCDIDKFKSVNDSYGHSAGDEAIKVFAGACIEGKRTEDILGRFGGEEFVLVLPDTNMQNALIVAERVRKILENKVVHFENVTFQMTSSFGIASTEHDTSSIQKIIELADGALYAAKQNGRNRVELYEAS